MNRTPIKKRRTKPRRGPLRDPKYRKWLRGQLCLIDTFSCQGEVDPCHTQNNGMSSKGPDSSCAPLCRFHHALYDTSHGDFEEAYQIDMKAIAKEFWERYLHELPN